MRGPHWILDRVASRGSEDVVNHTMHGEVMGCDIHLYVEKRNTEAQQHPTLNAAGRRMREAIVSGCREHEDDEYTTSVCKQFGITDRTGDRVRAQILVEQGLTWSPWRLLPPPERDETRWPRVAERDVFWGPHHCMYESRCYGYTRQVSGSDEWEEVDCPGDETCSRCHGHGRDMQWYHNRNYELFGILAGVRRPEMPRISDPRGVPGDVDVKTLGAAGWDHSLSWVTVREVLEFSWHKTAEHSGLLPVFPEGRTEMESFGQWMARTDGKSSPRGYCQGRSGRMVTLAEAKRLVQVPRVPPVTQPPVSSDDAPIVRVTWKETTLDSAPDFVEFVEEFIYPLLGDEFAQIRSVMSDAVEGAARTSGDDDPAALRRDWINAHRRRRDLAPMRKAALELAEDVRFVFGFDS